MRRYVVLAALLTLPCLSGCLDSGGPPPSVSDRPGAPFDPIKASNERTRDAMIQSIKDVRAEEQRAKATGRPARY